MSGGSEYGALGISDVYAFIEVGLQNTKIQKSCFRGIASWHFVRASCYGSWNSSVHFGGAGLLRSAAFFGFFGLWCRPGPNLAAFAMRDL